MLRENITFSHICPRYQLDCVNKEKINEAIRKTKGRFDYIVFDDLYSKIPEKINCEVARIVYSSSLLF